MTLRKDGIAEFIIEGSQDAQGTPVIYAVKTTKLLRQECQEFIATVLKIDEEKTKIDDISIVKKYTDVFPEDILGLPPDKVVEFSIDIVPGTTLVSKTPYWMAPAKIKELKVQLQELLDKGFIRPSMSPWGGTCINCEKER